MNVSLKPNTLIAHLLPGAFFLACLVSVLLVANPAWIATVKELSPSLIAVLGVFALIISLVLGLVFDAIRNLTETLWDKLSASDNDGRWWDFFFRGDEKHLEYLMENYYSYYVFDVNLVIALVASLMIISFLWAKILSRIFGGDVLPTIISVILVGVIVILVADARNLRRDIRRLALEDLLASDGEKVDG